jgi:hypothetical protein
MAESFLPGLHTHGSPRTLDETRHDFTEEVQKSNSTALQI